MTIVTTLALALFISAVPAAPAPGALTSAVERGLSWLAKQQREDGSWVGISDGYATYMTGHAGVALLMEGSTLKQGTYAPNLRRALAWVEANAATGGRLGGTHPTESTWDLVGHAAALQFLVCVHDVDDDEPRRERVAALIDRAITFLGESQADSGGWYYVCGQKDNDASYPTTAALQALCAARKSGFAVPRSLTDRGWRYLARATSRTGGVRQSVETFEAAGSESDRTATPGAAAAGLMTSDGPRPEELARWVKRARTGTAPQMQNFATDAIAMFEQYFTARSAFCLGEAGHRRLDPHVPEAELVRWSTYKGAAFKALVDAQGKDGDWPETFFGAVHSSALALIVLQLDNDHLPAFSR
jgi:hypothetical protein